jgi:hypothetical protein
VPPGDDAHKRPPWSTQSRGKPPLPAGFAWRRSPHCPPFPSASRDDGRPRFQPASDLSESVPLVAQSAPSLKGERAPHSGSGDSEGGVCERVTLASNDPYLASAGRLTQGRWTTDGRTLSSLCCPPRHRRPARARASLHLIDAGPDYRPLEALPPAGVPMETTTRPPHEGAQRPAVFNGSAGHSRTDPVG